MEILSKLLAFLNPTDNSTKTKIAGTATTVAAAIAAAIAILSQVQAVLCKLGILSACVSVPAA